MADQGNPKRRVEVIQKHAPDLGNAVTIGVAQQCDAVGILGLGTGKRLYKAGYDVLWTEDWRLRTVAFDHQHVAVRKHVERARMLESCGKRMDLQSVRHAWRVVTPRHRTRNPDRRQQILLHGRQHGIGADLASRIAAGIVAACKSESGDNESESSGDTLLICRADQFEGEIHERAPRRRVVRVQLVGTVDNSRMATTMADSVRPGGTTAV